MILYDAIVKGLEKVVPNNSNIEIYLNSLQESVKDLRAAYRKNPVHVEYENKNIQSAYLTTYLPHYYQLIYKIFIEDIPEIFQEKEEIFLTFIGGGPGSEAYGAIRYIVNNCPQAKTVNITILDINANTWKFSHDIVLESLIASIIPDDLKIKWQSLSFDLTSSYDLQKVINIIESTNLLVIQNCLNEIATTDFPALKCNINFLFSSLPAKSYLLMSDLTSGVRSTIKALEEMLIKEHIPTFCKSTLSNPSSISIMSVHHQPNPIIKKNLLTGADGLIPRKWIKYDYSVLSKGIVEEKIANEAIGFNAIYRPLDFKKLDANNYINTKTFIGIDFGTSTTVISIAKLIDGQIVIENIPIKQKDHLGGTTKSSLVPSIISLVDGNKLLVGKHAAEFKPYLEYGKNTWHSFKQNLSKLDDELFPNSVLINNKSIKISNAREALTYYFKYLKDKVFEYLDEESYSQKVEYSISIPAAFSSREKMNLKSCLLDAGIECEDTPFMEEPNAALINYLFEENINSNIEDKRKIIVVDLGAGTVDVSILLINSDDGGVNSRLLSTSRIGNIGGNRIDELVANKILVDHNIKNITDSLKIELISLCEQLKIKICKAILTDKTVEFNLPSLAISDNILSISTTQKLQDLCIKVEISYFDFNEIMKLYWFGENKKNGVVQTIEKALSDANSQIKDIYKVIVTGGSGRNPYIKNELAKYFHSSKVVIQDNIQEQVARGVALQSFVLNSFGKNIITPILSNIVFVEGHNKTIELFKTGITIPSEDFDVYLAEKSFSERRFITSYYGLEKLNKKYFEIPEKYSVEKLVFYIAPDQELKCDIVCSNFVKEASELFEMPAGKLLTLK